MPFRLTNVHATFCDLMNDVLYEYLDFFVVVYLDDVLVYNESLEDQLDHFNQCSHDYGNTSSLSRKKNVNFVTGR